MSATPNRRAFLSRSAGLSAAWASWSCSSIERAKEASSAVEGRSAGEIATDEDFWSEIARCFTVDRSILNLNNGGVAPAPGFVQEALKRSLDDAHRAPSRVMWQQQEPAKERVRRRLAGVAGVDPETVAITRNASEGLETALLGLHLERGDEVLTTDLDYPRMQWALDQRARREGILVRRIEPPIHVDRPTQLLRWFEEALQERTKAVLFCHMVNRNGQIYPARELCALLRERGIVSIVDGAHAFAQLEFEVGELDCDVYASSLHKWLSAPFGTGLLHVRRERIASIWPLLAAPAEMDDDIRKFEHIGTHPVGLPLSVAPAVEFHEAVGAARKRARLQHLKQSWAERFTGRDRVRFHTSLNAESSCALATVEVEGVDPRELAERLWERERIVVAAIVHPRFVGIRVTPHVYTRPADLDLFCEAFDAELRGL